MLSLSVTAVTTLASTNIPTCFMLSSLPLLNSVWSYDGRNGGVSSLEIIRFTLLTQRWALGISSVIIRLGYVC